VIHQGACVPIPHLIRELLIGKKSGNDDNPISKEAFSCRGFDGERLNLKENLDNSRKEMRHKNDPPSPQDIL